MEENRKKLTLVGMASGLILLVMIGYPVLKTKIKEYRQQDISLLQEETDGSVEEMRQETDTETNPAISDEEKPLKDQPAILLSVRGENQEVKVSLWQSENGTGYFFFRDLQEKGN